MPPNPDSVELPPTPKQTGSHGNSRTSSVLGIIPMSRRGFLKLAGSCLGSAMLNPGVWTEDILRGTPPVHDPSKEPPNRPDPNQEKLKSPGSPREERLKKLFIELFANSVFPDSELGLRLRSIPDNTPQFAPNSPKRDDNIPSWGAYRGKLITREDRRYKRETNTAIPERMRELGVKVNLYDLTTMLYERYSEILKNPQAMASSLDPNRSDFLTITEKYAKLTGFPADVIRAIWWRESIGNGTHPELHGGDSFHRDGPMAIFWPLYHAQVSFDGKYDYTGKAKRVLIPGVTPRWSTNVFAMPADLRLPRYRKTDDILVTHIPVELARVDPELNIIIGLMLYYQAASYTAEDPLIRYAYEMYLSKNELPNTEENFWAFSYSVYHHGGIPSQQEIERWDEDKYCDTNYFGEQARLFSGTLRSNSWGDPYYIGPSRLPEDKGLPDEFFYIHKEIPPAISEKLKEYLIMYDSLNPSNKADEWWERDFAKEALLGTLATCVLCSDNEMYQYLVDYIQHRSDLTSGAKNSITQILQRLKEIASDQGIGRLPPKKPGETLLEFRHRLAGLSPAYDFLLHRAPELYKIGITYNVARWWERFANPDGIIKEDRFDPFVAYNGTSAGESDVRKYTRILAGNKVTPNPVIDQEKRYIELVQQHPHSAHRLQEFLDTVREIHNKFWVVSHILTFMKLFIVASDAALVEYVVETVRNTRGAESAKAVQTILAGFADIFKKDDLRLPKVGKSTHEEYFRNLEAESLPYTHLLSLYQAYNNDDKNRQLFESLWQLSDWIVGGVLPDGVGVIDYNIGNYLKFNPEILKDIQRKVPVVRRDLLQLSESEPVETNQTQKLSGS